MDSKVDYLLKNNPIDYVVQVQKKIKSDIERKKDDLRALIGERYNELLEATQSMEDMKCSVEIVINSLKDLNQILQSDFENDDSISIPPKIDPETQVSEILLDMPLKIWNLLYVENVSRATLHYFAAIYAYRQLEEKSSILYNNQTHRFNRITLEDMNTNIVIKGWTLIEQKLKSSVIDMNDVCHILLSLLILIKCNLSQLSQELYSRQCQALKSTVANGNRKELQQILNIVHNTILCSKLFDSHSGNGITVEKAFTDLLQSKDLSVLDEDSKPELEQYFGFSYEKQFREHSISIDFTMPKHCLEQWFESSKEIIKGSLEKAQRNVETISDLYREIKETEKTLVDECRFADWREIDGFDIQDSIWKGCIVESFQARVYEIVDQRTAILLEQTTSMFTSEAKNFRFNDSNTNPNSKFDSCSIVNSVWCQQKSKANSILDSCSRIQNILNQEFEKLAEELKILVADYRIVLVRVCERIQQFLARIKDNIPGDCRELRLFGALLFRDIHQQCPGLSRILSFSDKTFQETVHKQSLQICCDFYNDWFEHRIHNLVDSFDKNSYSDLTTFLSNLTVWDRITIQAESSQQSILEVPLQMSLSTYDLFTKVSEDINRFSAHSLPKSVLVRIFSLLGKQFLVITKESLDSVKSSSLPGSVKQTMAIQLYFDLLFLKCLFSSPKLDSARKQVISSIGEQLVSLESLIDPFDLHLMVPYMKKNAEKLHRSCGLLLSFLRADKIENRFKNAPNKNPESGIGKQELNGEQSITNTMWLHSCQSDLLS